MAQKIITGNGIVCLDTVDCEEDLKLQPGINLNPPPEDGRCNCCRRHINELKPFGGPGDPLVGDHTGCLLVKNFRADGPYDEESERLFEEAECRFKDEGFADVFEYLHNKYGEEEGQNMFFRASFSRSVSMSWECRDCFVLREEGYFEKKFSSANVNISDNLNAELGNVV